MISQTAEYALRAIVFLAKQDGAIVNRRDLAEATQVPSDYLTKVLQDLDQAGLVRAQRGPGGGYSFIASPIDVTVYDVVSAVSVIPRITTCPLGISDHVELCPLHKRLDEAAEHVECAFQKTTIKSLLTKKGAGSRCPFPGADDKPRR